MSFQRISLTIITIAALSTWAALFSQISAASSASMTLSGSVNTSGKFDVTVYENSGSTTVTGAKVTLTFTGAPVANVSYDYSVGPFTAITPSGEHNSYGTVTGLQPVARVSFTVTKPGTVTATVGADSYLKHVEGIDIVSLTINRGHAAFTYAAPTPTPAATVIPTAAPTATPPANLTPTPTRAVAGKVAQHINTDDDGQVEGTSNATNKNEAEVSPTPSKTSSPSAAPLVETQGQSQSKWPWAAAGFVVIVAAVIGAYYWRRRHK